MREELERRLQDLGASDDELARAEDQGWLPLIALDRMLVPGARVYDAVGLARAAGLEPEFARRLWRALGFPDVPDGLALFSERDAEAARLAVAQSTPRELEEGILLQQVRVISGSLARIAAVEADAFSDSVEEARAAGVPDEEIALGIFSDVRFGNIAVLLDYVHRLQLRAAMWRRLAFVASPDLAVAVGFADLSGYTELSAALAPPDLSSLLRRWEAIAHDTLTGQGARVVKTIGDEVMFVGLTEAAVRGAVALRASAGNAGLPALRMGIATGPVVSRDGDFYGPVVNLASRLTEVAHRGDVLVSREVRDDLRSAGVADLRVVARGRQFLRSMGDVEVFAVELA